MIKLISIDLDGTLLNSNSEIDQENIKAVKYAQKKGCQIVLCTGRPYSLTKSFADQLGVQSGYVVTNNGANIQNLSGETIGRFALGREDIQHWLSFCQRLDVPLNVVDSRHIYTIEPAWSPYPSLYYNLPTSRIPKIIHQEDLLGDVSFDKVVICQKEELLDKVESQLKPSDVKTYHFVRSEPILLEILNPKANKLQGLRCVLDQVQIDLSEVMAIGDQANDLELLKASGVSVAMENAIDMVKESADYTTASNDQSGVAQAIYHYLEDKNK